LRFNKTRERRENLYPSFLKLQYGIGSILGIHHHGIPKTKTPLVMIAKEMFYIHGTISGSPHQADLWNMFFYVTHIILILEPVLPLGRTGLLHSPAIIQFSYEKTFIT
jgi:hypothetical protein